MDRRGQEDIALANGKGSENMGKKREGREGEISRIKRSHAQELNNLNQCKHYMSQTRLKISNINKNKNEKRGLGGDGREVEGKRKGIK